MTEQEIKELLHLQYFPNLHIYMIELSKELPWIKVLLPNTPSELEEKEKCERSGGIFICEDDYLTVPTYPIVGTIDEKICKITRDVISLIGAANADNGGNYIPPEDISVNLFIYDIYNNPSYIGASCTYDRSVERLDETKFELVKEGSY